jgi:hypothetical protein
MSNIALAVTTGIPPIDATLLGIVRAFEHAFPNRVRAYYLSGFCQQMLAFENEFLQLCDAPDKR